MVFSYKFNDTFQLELGLFDKEGELKKRKIETVDESILDLAPQVITALRKNPTGEAYASHFLIDGWNYAGTWGKPPAIRKSELFVTSEKLRRFLKNEPEIAKRMGFTIKQKPGPKTGKKDFIKKELLQQLHDGRKTLESLIQQKDESLMTPSLLPHEDLPLSINSEALWTLQSELLTTANMLKMRSVVSILSQSNGLKLSNLKMPYVK